MARPGLRKVQRYSLEFKRTAVRLSRQRGISVQAVAAALDIHPFMLSRWRKEAREGRLRGGAGGPERPRAPRRELARLARLEREHALLLEEHALLKKAIRFCSARRQRRSRSSRANGRRSP